MKILIIGASSYLGARLFFDLSKKYEIIGTYNSNKLSKKFIFLDITNKKSVEKVIFEIKPDIIIHVANNPNSKWCEENKEKAKLLNETSTEFIVNASNQTNSKFIFISSITAVEATDYYGKLKRNSEELVKQMKDHYLILRPSLILGMSPNSMNDRTFNRLLKNIDEKIPVKYESLWKFQSTYIRQISEIIDACIQKNIWNELIYPLVTGESTRFKIAKDLLKNFGIEVEEDKSNRSFPDNPKINLEYQNKFAFPQYSYEQMIAEIKIELTNRESFQI